MSWSFSFTAGHLQRGCGELQKSVTIKQTCAVIWLQILLSCCPLCSRPARLLPAEGWDWVLPVLLRRRHRTGPRSQHSLLLQKPSWAKHGEQPGRWTPGHHNTGIRCKRQIGSKIQWLYIYQTLYGCIFELADGLLTDDKSSVWKAELVISTESRGHKVNKALYWLNVFYEPRSSSNRAAAWRLNCRESWLRKWMKMKPWREL